MDNVPDAVLKEFKIRFSIAEKTTWELQDDDYLAEFRVGKSDFSTLFDKEGKWFETQTYLKTSELPKAIKDYLIKDFGELSGYKINDAEKIESADKGIHYELDVEKGELSYEMTFTELGAIINKLQVLEKK